MKSNENILKRLLELRSEMDRLNRLVIAATKVGPGSSILERIEIPSDSLLTEELEEEFDISVSLSSDCESDSFDLSNLISILVSGETSCP